MDNSELFTLVISILGPLVGIITGAFAVIKIFFRYKSKILFITNCQILHKKIWADLVKYHNIKKHEPMDHAFRPLVLLPEYLKKYINIENKQKAVLESISPYHERSLKIIAEVYWIPDKEIAGKEEWKHMRKWSKISHPVFSLILRRYFGMERPMYQDETEKDLDKTKWQLVRHSTKHLDKLHRIDAKDPNMMQWAMNADYTNRYFNPGRGKKGRYESEPSPSNFIEYCGFSISLRKRSWMHIERE